jgi:hypothetical protein
MFAAHARKKLQRRRIHSANNRPPDRLSRVRNDDIMRPGEAFLSAALSVFSIRAHRAKSRFLTAEPFKFSHTHRNTTELRSIIVFGMIHSGTKTHNAGVTWFLI